MSREVNDMSAKITSKFIDSIISHFTVISFCFGICSLFAGTVFRDYDKPQVWYDLFMSIGTTFLSISLINVVYQKWQDKKLYTRIENIETYLHIKNSDLTGCLPGIPEKIFKPGKSKDDPIRKALIASLRGTSDHYYYMGISMSTMAKAIAYLELNDIAKASFIIPHPKYVENERNKMKESIGRIIKGCMLKNIDIEFIILNYIPPFHIHLTTRKCWFAFVDQRWSGDTGSTIERYPATYQYKKDDEKNNNSVEMYHTIANTINTLYEREKKEESYAFEFKAKILKIKQTKKENRVTTEKEITKDNVLDVIEDRDIVEFLGLEGLLNVNKNESRS